MLQEYETLHTDEQSKGGWVTGSECSGEVNLMATAWDTATNRVKEVFPCLCCAAKRSSKRLEKLCVTHLDAVKDKTMPTPKRDPALIFYHVKKSWRNKKMMLLIWHYQKKSKHSIYPTICQRKKFHPCI